MRIVGRLFLLNCELEIDLGFQLSEKGFRGTRFGWISHLWWPFGRKRFHVRTLERAFQTHHVKRRLHAINLVAGLLHIHFANANALIHRARFEQVNKELEITLGAGAEKPTIVDGVDRLNWLTCAPRRLLAVDRRRYFLSKSCQAPTLECWNDESVV